MAPRFASAKLTMFVGLVCAFATAAAEPAPAQSKRTRSDLHGTWFVLIHYKDAATKNADADRWLDKVWTFDMQGSRLHWVEYPLVVLESPTGRFEAYKGNPRSRVLAKWEPDERQLEEIMGGPRVNSRGSKSKSLRGSDTKGWASMGSSRVAGVNVIGFHEDWAIEAEGGRLEFSITEVMGNAARGNAEGVTTYTVESGDPTGEEMTGRFNRDGTRIGIFRMFRTPPIRALLSSEEEDSVNKRRELEAFEALKRISE